MSFTPSAGTSTANRVQLARRPSVDQASVAAKVRTVPDQFVYRYEIRRGDEVIATGHLTLDQLLSVGETVKIGRLEGLVESVEPTLADRELQLVVCVSP